MFFLKVNYNTENGIRKDGVNFLSDGIKNLK